MGPVPESESARMHAIVYNQAEDDLHMCTEYRIPDPVHKEALIEVIRAGVCSTDLEIIRGYVPGFKYVLGHEFVGVVRKCDSRSDWVGTRVVGDINCNVAGFSCSSAIFQRNHAPGRTVLGIIGKDGTMAQYVTLPVENLHAVPDGLTDLEACFTEPVAAACRIGEQGLVGPGDTVAVVGDGKLGLLIAQVLVIQGARVTLVGRHPHKMELVSGLEAQVVSIESTASSMAAAFDTVVEATGSPDGIRLSLALLRPLGTLVLKSTVSLTAKNVPGWSELANDIVVNEKRVVGSRCGPFPDALQVLQDSRMKALVNRMVSAEFPLAQGLEAIRAAYQKGALKVQLLCSGTT